MEKIITIDTQKAYAWYAEKNGLNLEEVKQLPFFNNVFEVFEYIHTDVNSNYDDLSGTIETLANIEVADMVRAGVETVGEFMVLQWGRLVITPYGYLAIDI